MGYEEEKRYEVMNNNAKARQQEWAIKHAQEQQDKRFHDELMVEFADKEKDKTQTKEELRQYTFQDVKKVYKNGSKFERLLRKANGIAPNWKEIEQYDQKNLDYLLKVSRGETKAQKDAVKAMEKRAMEGKRDYPSEKELSAKRFEKFASKLGLSKSQLTLERQMEYANENNMSLAAVQELEETGRSR